MKLQPVFRGYSWVGLANVLVLQWFFIRLQVAVNHKLDIVSWKIIGLIWPTTGWDAPYKYLRKL